jgi:hypothetical protein
LCRADTEAYSASDLSDCEQDELILAMRGGSDASATSKRRNQWRDLCLFPNAILQTPAAHDCREKWQGEALRLTREEGAKREEAYWREDAAKRACIEALPSRERSIDLYTRMDQPPTELDPGADPPAVHVESLPDRPGWMRVRLESGELYFIEERYVAEVVFLG